MLSLGAGGSTRMSILSGGNVGIAMTDPSVALDVTGDIEYTGTITDVSDIRLKENIEPIDGALDKLLTLNGVSFNMIGDDRRNLGFTAQEVQKVFPEAVSVVDPENGYLGLDYTQMAPPLLEGIKELYGKVQGIGTNEKGDVIIKNGNVGIGTTGPGAKLEVAGQVKITGGTPGAGEVLTSDAVGLATWEPVAVAGVPSGFVGFFNLGVCPSGWTALVAAQGRYLVGLPSAGTLAGTAGTALTNLENRAVGQHNHGITDPGHAHSIPASGSTASENAGGHTGSGSTGSAGTGLTINNTGAVVGTNAPYLQLLVCQKD